MIIVRILGGLGNQMFQYATGRALAYQRNTTLKLDVSSFRAYRLRPYQLSIFNIQEDFATQSEVARLDWSVTTGIVYRSLYLLRRLFQAYRASAIFHESGSYDARIWETPPNVYLNGYFQSEQYFLNIRDLLRAEFTFKISQKNENLALAHQIQNTQAVSIHIRRGDYAASSKINQKHGLCSLDYYNECVQRISAELVAPHFYVFSDDPAWAIENLHLNAPTTFISHNTGLQAYEDLRLMSTCQHHIIANSSFSWWGAWLNSNHHKLVYAPARWYNDPGVDSRFIIPESWIKV